MFRTLISKAASVAACAAIALSFAAPARAVTIIVNGSTCSWDGSTLTCNANNNGPSAPSCTLTANPTALPSGGGQTALAANCTNSPTSYAWTATTAPSSGFSAAAGSAQTPTIAATTTFTVTASNAAGPGNAAPVTVTVSGGGGGGSPPSCAAQGYTVLGGNAISIPFGTSATYFSSASGSFGDNAVWLLTFTPTAATTGYGRVVVSEYGGNAFAREITISTTPCDFRWPPDPNNQTGPALGGNGSTASVYYGAGSPPSFPWVLAPNTQYYISIRNWQWSPPGPSCGGSDCRAVLTVTGAN
jgi:hypothetical protein